MRAKSAAPAARHRVTAELALFEMTLNQAAIMQFLTFRHINESVRAAKNDSDFTAAPHRRRSCCCG